LQRRVTDGNDRLSRTAQALQRSGAQTPQRAAQALTQAARLLESLSPYSTLLRGYAVVRGRKGGVITTVPAAQKAAELVIEFHDGSIEVSTAAPQGRLF
jgi:exonuclease VII large subunit